MHTLTRSEVYAAIDAERDYQDWKWGNNQPQSLPGLILVIEAELEEAKKGWIKNLPGKSAPLNELVQVAATCVAALEKYGTSGCPYSTDDIPPSAMPADEATFIRNSFSHYIDYAKEETRNDDQRYEARRPEGTTEPREAASSGDLGVPGLDWGLYFGSGNPVEPVLLRQD